MAEIEKTKAGNRGKCINCERDNLFIASKDGHCCTCKAAVKDLTPESPEYASALAAVKIRLSEPRPKHQLKEALKKIKKPLARSKAESLPVEVKKDHEKRRQIIKAAQKLKEDKEETALDLLVAEQAYLTYRLGKVSQAIEILS